MQVLANDLCCVTLYVKWNAVLRFEVWKDSVIWVCAVYLCKGDGIALFLRGKKSTMGHEKDCAASAAALGKHFIFHEKFFSLQRDFRTCVKL